MDTELLKYIGQLGGGGLLALAAFMFWRKDVKEMFEKNREDRERSEKRIAELGTDFKDTIERNTEVSTKLCTLIEQSFRNVNGNGIR